jgi:anti-sigma factor RsiW
MNDQCEYFERLISDSADAQLDQTQQEELRNHLATCAHCREFQSSVIRSSALLRRLPELETDISLRAASSSARKPNPLMRIWKYRISLPAPLAVAALLVVIGLSLWGTLRHPVEPAVQTVQPATTINYVQVEQIPAGSGTPLSAPKKTMR